MWLLGWLLCLSTTLALFGCSTVRQEHLTHGHMLVSISCSGLFSSWQGCLDEARRACGDDHYTVMERSNPSADDEPTFLGINPAGFTSRDMVVACNPPP
ncbi:hypothetical protein [Pseudomonas atacamensis]|uniref:hypothetical protein n=1 Tax=Pseudomonas atacamensis TaxID=2565368 RepID=UPI0024478428|nr:hypothetical protein [Pseudomonas atacamensis]MDH2076835.1 hypothetical protein [Pseudomonas atacamensis]